MEFLFKVLLIGDPKVGKTSFVNRYAHDTFLDEYKATIGVDFALKEIYWHDHRKIKLQLWDIAGQERYSSMTRVYYKESSGCILMFDLSDRKSFNSVLKWKRDLDTKCIFGDGKPIPCILLANKSDIKNRSVEQNDIEILCKENGFIGWSEISVKENLMIENSIDYLIECILDRHKGIETNLDTSIITNNRNGIYRLDDRSQNKKAMCDSC